MYVEKIILKTFLNNIDINLASVVINRNISKLRDAYNILEREGLIRNEIDKNKPYVNKFNVNHRTSIGNERFINRTYNSNSNDQGNLNRQNYFTNSGQSRNTSNFNNRSSGMQHFNNTRGRFNNNQHDRRTYQSCNNQYLGQNSSSQMAFPLNFGEIRTSRECGKCLVLT